VGVANAIGINLTHSVKASITENQVKGAAGATNCKGIYVSQSPQSSICNNIVQKLNFGIECSGNTMLPSTINNNNINHNVIGFELSNVGIVGQQGSSTTAANNSFTANTNNTRTSGSTNGSSSPFYNGPSLVTGNIAVSPSTVISFFTTTGASSTCGIPCTGPGCSPLLAQQFHDIALGNDVYLVNQDNNHWFAKQAMYKSMLTDTLPWDDDTLLEHFRNDVAGTTLGLLENVKDAMINPDAGTLDLDHASLLNASLVTGNSIESDAQTVNNVMLLVRKENSRPLTTDEQDIIRNIAILCPFIDGYPVYEARAIISAYDGVDVVYNDNCSEGHSLQTLPTENTNENKSLPADNFMVFPNPNNGEMQLSYTLTSATSATVTLYDMGGRMMYSNKIDARNNMLTISKPDLGSGVYYYTVRVDNKELKTGKIVIVH
jgi:hypothetical protein